jgi:hypothetical protein
MKQHLPPVLTLALMILACNGDGQPTSTPAAPVSGQQAATTTSSTGDMSERDSWLKPEVIIETMSIPGPLAGKVVADLYADDGYFTIKLLQEGARVIAIQRDKGAADALRVRAAEAGFGPEKLEVRLVQGNEAGISMEEADLALLYGNYRNIADKRSYFAQVRSGLKGLNQLWIIDWLPKESPVGPPMEMRISDAVVMDEMELHGFTDIGSWSAKLPYHFLMFCMDFPEEDPNMPGGMPPPPGMQ